tara:strand:+ start:661 stop:786 length:126 start_codon:yes stop_codon:yes gene_type:complete
MQIIDGQQSGGIQSNQNQVENKDDNLSNMSFDAQDQKKFVK